jgi:hypothetical protein
MKKQIANLLEKYTADDLIEEIGIQDKKRKDIAAYEKMSSAEREQHFRDYVKLLKLTIGEENENCIYIKEFKDLQKMNIDCPNPYFMFWKEPTDDKSRKAHIEFGHWHMNRKWDKEYPTTEYVFQKSWIESTMWQYREQLKEFLKT